VDGRRSKYGFDQDKVITLGENTGTPSREFVMQVINQLL
jgi:hypothetical protein